MSKITSSKTISVIFSVLVLTLAVGFYVFGWTEPSAAPPSGNVLPPVRLSPTAFQIDNSGSPFSPSIWLKNSGGDDLLRLQTGDTDATVKFVVGNDGNVGIGTTSPGRHLHVAGATLAVILMEDKDAGTDLKKWGIGSSDGTFAINRYTDANSFLSTSLLIDSSGNVGIGTTNPNAKLEVSGRTLIADTNEGYGAGLSIPTGDIDVGGGADSMFGIRHLNVAGKDNLILFGDENSGGVPAGPWTMAIDTETDNVGIGTTDPGVIRTGAENSGTVVHFLTDELLIEDGSPEINFVNLNFGAEPVESNWRFGSGSTDYLGISVTDPLDVNNHYRWELVLKNYDGTGDGDTIDKGDYTNVGIGMSSPNYKLDVNGEVGAWDYNWTSDARLKENINPLTDILEKLEKIHGISFYWNKEAGELLGRSPDDREIGVLAQEVESVFPELVSTASNTGYKSVDYGRLTAVLIEGVKELKAENESLEQRIEFLEQKLSELEGK